MLSYLRKIFLNVNTKTIYFYSFIIGVIAGLVSICFYKAIHWLTDFTHTGLAGFHVLKPGEASLNQALSSDYNRLILFCLPIVGGLLTGLCIHFLAPEAAGGGTESFLDAFHNKAGVVRKRTGPVKFLASLFTLSSGGSAGKEGPMTLIGASIGSLFGKFIKMGARAQRTLLLAGAAGGLGAIFRTPLGGAITAVEVLYKEDIESDALIPCIISSVTAYTVFGSYLGFGHFLHFSTGVFHSPVELIFYVLLAIVCTFSAYLFTKTYHSISHVFAKIPVPRVFLPAVGGLFVAAIGLFVPEVLGGSLGVIQQAINGTYSSGSWVKTCWFFLLLAILKMFTTAFTVRSGGSGGTLVPSFFIGGALGGLVGTVCNAFFPELVPSVTPFIIVGMASFFAAATSASLGALVMVTELTGGYELLPPLMVVCVISLIMSHRWSIYRNQVPNKFFSKAHLWDMNPRILKTISISAAFEEFRNIAILGHKMLLVDIKKQARKVHASDFIVQDDNQVLLGILSLKDLEFEDEEDEDTTSLNDVCVAGDMLHTETIYVTPDDTLFQAMKYLSAADFDKIPVIDNKKDKKLLGYLRRRDILAFYNGLGEQPSDTN
jgi:chloride channel protein, CIC family